MKVNKSILYAVDLFAGCGGLSEGFKQAGFEIVAQVEMDKWACKTLRTRNLYYELKKRRKSSVYNRYIQEKITKEDIYLDHPDIKEIISNSVIQATFGKDRTEEIFSKIKMSMKCHGAKKTHVLLGGPPCQPYSLVGRARDPDRMQKDQRHFLYKYYLEIIEHFKPDFFVYENVPGLFTARARGREIFLKLLYDFSSLRPSYAITPPFLQIYSDPCSYVLNSVDFQIPQKRKRLILIGYRKSLEKQNLHIVDVFSKLQKLVLKNRKKGFLSVGDAIGDLPALRPGDGKDGWYSTYDSDSNMKAFQIKMRKNSAGILNHRARTHMSGDIERYRFFVERHLNGNKSTTLTDLIKERPDLTPDHDHLDKFLDRFKVQWWTKPSSTITAHISKDGHYYIHPDISQCRSFTVREAARCQSFPDNYKFEGPRTHQFRQVGNAVPPILAYETGKILIKELKKIYGK